MAYPVEVLVDTWNYSCHLLSRFEGQEQILSKQDELLSFSFQSLYLVVATASC